LSVEQRTKEEKKRKKSPKQNSSYISQKEANQKQKNIEIND
jgi:hypothetical protein